MSSSENKPGRTLGQAAGDAPRGRRQIRIASEDFRKTSVDEFFFDDEEFPRSPEGNEIITADTINELLENMSSDEDEEIDSNWDDQLELEWDDSLIDTPLSTASSSHDFQSQVQKIVINGKEYKINCSVIAPYLDVLQHAGYTREGLSAVIVFQARKLPLKSEPNYAKIMHHLFLHFLLEISNLVADSYCLLVFTREGTLPPLKWLRDCYRLISRPLRKSLRQFVVVEPTWWTRLSLAVVRPFVSAKFYQKIITCSSIDTAEEIVDFDSRYARDMIES